MITLREAETILGLDRDWNERDLKAAYRAGVRRCPPDADPDGFRRVRQAFEILGNPHARAKELLSSFRPLVEPPPLGGARAGDTALRLFRAAVGKIDAERLAGAIHE